MTTDSIIQDVQSLAVSSGIVELYELQVTESPDTYLYFTNMYYDASSSTKITMRDRDGTDVRTYEPIPASLSGLSFKAGGPMPQPKLQIANVLKTGSNSIKGALDEASFEDILGLKFYRRRTLKKYLYNVDTSSDPGVEFPVDMYYLDRIEAETPTHVSFVLTSPFDLSGVHLPRRTIIGNMCPWEYQGAGNHLDVWERKGGCTWNEESKISIEGVEYRAFVNSEDEYIVPSSTSFTTDPGSGTRTLDLYYKTTTTSLTKIAAGGSQTSGGTVTQYWQAAAGNTSVPADNSSDWDRVRVYTAYSMANAVNVYAESKHNSYVLDGSIESISISNGGSGYTSAPTVTIDAPDIGTTNGVQATGTAIISNGAVTAVSIENVGHGYVEGETVSVSFSGGGGSSAAATNPTVVTRLWQARRESQSGTTNRVQPGFNSYWSRGDICGKRITSCKKRFGYNPIATLAYDGQSANFTAGKQLTGGTSKATATIVTDTDGGSTGTLTLSNVTGVFQNNETITDDNSSPGSATVNGTLGGAINSRGKSTLRTLDSGPGLPHGGFPTARRMGK